MKFDLVIMNPPYGALGNKFLQHVCAIGRRVISVQPTGWVLSKSKSKEFIEIYNKPNISELEIINAAKYFDAGILGQIGIIDTDFSHNGKFSVIFEETNNKVEFDSYKDVVQNQLDPFINEFNNIIKPLYIKDNLENHIIKPYKNNIDKETYIKLNKPIFRFSGIRGHKDTKTGKPMADFYTLITNNEDEIKNKVLLSTTNLNDVDKNGKPIVLNFIMFDSKQEQMNFYNFIRTDFCRACFMIMKQNVHFDSGELKYVPWFDFNNNLFNNTPKDIDNILYNMYNIPVEIRKYIETELDDYYKIR